MSTRLITNASVSFVMIMGIGLSAVAQTPVPAIAAAHPTGELVGDHRIKLSFVPDTSPPTLESSPSSDIGEALGDLPLAKVSESGIDSKDSLPVLKREPAVKINPLTGMGHTDGASYRPLTRAERWQLYLNQTVLPPAYIGMAWSTLVDHISNNPNEWGRGAEGFGKRVASRFAGNLVGSTLQAVGTAVTGEDPRYIRSTDRGFIRRTRHALAFTVMTYNREGKPTPAFAGIAAQYASSLITQTWMPHHEHPWRDGLRDGTIQFAFGGMFNVVEEFWPELTRLMTNTIRLRLSRAAR